MTTIKEKVAKNYIDYPLNKRIKTINLKFEEKDYKNIKYLANINNISIEEFIFMVLLEELGKESFYLSNVYVPININEDN